MNFNVIGNLDRSATGGSSINSSGGNSSEGGSATSDTSPTSTITTALYGLTYDPLLNTFTSKQFKP